METVLISAPLSPPPTSANSAANLGTLPLCAIRSTRFVPSALVATFLNDALPPTPVNAPTVVWGGCPVRKKAAQTIIHSMKPVPLMSLKITPPPHFRKPLITVTSHRNPNPYWPETRPPAVTSARKHTKIAPKQPTSLRSEDSQIDNTTPKQPAPVINQSSQTHDTLTPERPTSLSNQSTQADNTPAKNTDTDTEPDDPLYSLELIDYLQLMLHPHTEGNGSPIDHLSKPLSVALETSVSHIDPENSPSLKNCQENIQQLVFMMHQTLQAFGVLGD